LLCCRVLFKKKKKKRDCTWAHPEVNIPIFWYRYSRLCREHTYFFLAREHGVRQATGRQPANLAVDVVVLFRHSSPIPHLALLFSPAKALVVARVVAEQSTAATTLSPEALLKSLVRPNEPGLGTTPAVTTLSRARQCFSLLQNISARLRDLRGRDPLCPWILQALLKP
jgi:hypothetical protein